ncbi:MAG: transaldolase [Leptospiraceae bacterium]|nr:fructose-6-phosphate aldolase [Leptospiraceae bacterium]MCP5503479.1 transaldolase [Leptospiraceae bacterium]
MKYFLDSAKIDEIKYAYENWGIDGVTTNPKHIKTSGKPFYSVIREIGEYFEGTEVPVSVEINPTLTEKKDMIEMAKKLAALSPNFAIKIPCTEQGLSAAKALNDDGIKTNVTLVFTASQAIQVARIGSKFCSPFIGWGETNGEFTLDTIGRIMEIYKNYQYKTEVITAAVRNGKQLAEAALYGSDIATAGFDVFKDSFFSPYTGFGNDIFINAWKETDTSET